MQKNLTGIAFCAALSVLGTGAALADGHDQDPTEFDQLYSDIADMGQATASLHFLIGDTFPEAGEYLEASQCTAQSLQTSTSFGTLRNTLNDFGLSDVELVAADHTYSILYSVNCSNEFERALRTVTEAGLSDVAAIELDAMKVIADAHEKRAEALRDETLATELPISEDRLNQVLGL